MSIRSKLDTDRATAVPFAPSADIPATDVQRAVEAALATASAALAAHLADTVAAHAATAISFTPAGSIAAIEVQAALVELDGDITTVAGNLAAHIADATAAHAASAISFSPTGNIAATDAQAAIAELDTEKLAASSYTAADVLAKLLTVDGSGSGLDADLLDGMSSAAFAAAVHTHVSTDITDFTEASQDVVGTMLTASEGTGDIDWTYTDGSNTLTGAVKSDAITYAKIQNVSAQYRLLGRTSSGAGDVEEVTTSAFIVGLLDDADAATALATLTAAGQGRNTIWVPATAMYSRTTNGAASGTTEMATNKNMFKTFDFDTTTQEFVQFEVAFPKSWDEGTVTFQPVLSHASGSGNVVFGLAGVARSNDDAGDVAFGTAQTSDRTVGTANDIYIGPESSAITIAGSPAAGDTVQFQVNRTVASDNLGVDARLHGVILYFTTNAATDT